MKKHVTESEGGFKWVDIINPAEKDMKKLAKNYKLHPASVKDCMEPFHLPKIEYIHGTLFIIARYHDHKAPDDADSVQQLTNKLAFFISKNRVITIHRADPKFLSDIRKQNLSEHDEDKSPIDQQRLINTIMDDILMTYQGALNNLAEQIDACEAEVFRDERDKRIIQELYHYKHRTSIFKRLLFLTKEMVRNYRRMSDINDPYSQDVMDLADSLYFAADEESETVSNLLNLQLSLASQKTNEIVTILTIFSAFFLPLTFIVGLYGMNFRYMPELTSRYGYPGVIAVMIVTVVGIYIWFRKRDWI